jgi:hypothetical protein
VCTVKNSGWWTEELSETCRVLFQNKFEKLVHLVGFIIRNLSRCTATWTSNLCSSVMSETLAFLLRFKHKGDVLHLKKNIIYMYHVFPFTKYSAYTGYTIKPLVSRGEWYRASFLNGWKKIQLDVPVVYIYCSCWICSTCFGRVRPSSGALEN